MPTMAPVPVMISIMTSILGVTVYEDLLLVIMGYDVPVLFTV